VVSGIARWQYPELTDYVGINVGPFVASKMANGNEWIPLDMMIQREREQLQMTP
jgi:hypothetical protein